MLALFDLYIKWLSILFFFLVLLLLLSFAPRCAPWGAGGLTAALSVFCLLESLLLNYLLVRILVYLSRSFFMGF
jgi:hypothetical protein